MTIKTKAFILTVIKYNDFDAIIKAYAEKTGFTAYYIKGFFRNKSGKIKRAFFQPGAILDLVAGNKNNGKLEFIREVQPAYHYKNINTDFDKLNTSIFLREILQESLKNEQADSELFQYITNAFIKLDHIDFYPDFHLDFLIKLTQYLGFAPSINTVGTYFDMENGIFTENIYSGNFLNKEDSLLLKEYLGTIFDSNPSIKVDQKQRQKLLQILLDFFQVHIDAFKMPKSIKILSQLYK